MSNTVHREDPDATGFCAECRCAYPCPWSPEGLASVGGFHLDDEEEEEA